MKNNINDPNWIKFKFYLNEAKSGDQNAKDKIIEMLMKQELVCFVNDTTLQFAPHSKFKNKCSRCGKYYMAGDPAFYYNLEGSEKFHEHCATQEEKQNCKFYQEYLAKQNGGI